MELDPVKNTVWVKLPFIANLKPNRFVAERVFKTQLELTRKNPSLREDTVKSHQKLVDRGHVAEESELPKAYLEVIKASPGEGYFIPPMENRQQGVAEHTVQDSFRCQLQDTRRQQPKWCPRKRTKDLQASAPVGQIQAGAGDRHR
jgi:hypothetical protein